MTDSDLTLLAILADRSGSMSTLAKDMNGGIRQMLADQANNPGTVIVDIVTFDTEVEHPFDWVRPDDVKVDIIVPRGSTALNDALGMTIVRLGERLAAMDEEDRPGKVIFVVVTDGEENASREYTLDQVRGLVTTQIDYYGWEFIYLATNVDAFATGRGYGFNDAQTMSYAGSPQGTQNAWAAASAGVTRSRLGGVSDFTDDERAQAGGES